MGRRAIREEGHIFEVESKVGNDRGFAFFEEISVFFWGGRGEF